MPKESKLPGKLGDVARVLGTPAAAQALGISLQTFNRYRDRSRWPDGFAETLNRVHREVCK